MEQTARDFMSTHRVPALSVAFAKDERLAYVKAFGIARPGEAVTPGHLFRIASLSKPITAVTVLVLVEQGKVRLTDRVFGPGGVLGTAFGAPPYRRWVDEITVDHLLTHTAGGWTNDNRDPMFTYPHLDHRGLITATLANAPLVSAPGERWAYSNFGYCILGRVIEQVGGAPYAAVVKREILSKCGISGMEIAGNTLADRRRNEVAYLEQSAEDPYGMPVSRMDAHGGWLATPTDLVRFLARVDQNPRVPDLLRPGTLATLFTPTSARDGAGYARGWNINAQKNYWHLGGLPGTTTVMVRTSGGFCWALLTNTRRPGLEVALDRLAWDMVGKIRTWPSHDLFAAG